jgi:hypothetical protein
MQKQTSKISLIIDAWTSSNGYAFMAIVARFINADFELGKHCWIEMHNNAETRAIEELLIDFREIIGEHSGKNFADIVWNTICLYGIQEKVRHCYNDPNLC